MILVNFNYGRKKLQLIAKSLIAERRMKKKTLDTKYNKVKTQERSNDWVLKEVCKKWVGSVLE